MLLLLLVVPHSPVWMIPVVLILVVVFLAVQCRIDTCTTVESQNGRWIATSTTWRWATSGSY
jgi:hypothetical protein